MPSSRSVPRCLPVRGGRARHVEDVVEQLEREPDAAPEAAEQLDRPAALERPELARGLEQARRLEVAAGEVALARRRRVPRVGALHQLALGERRGGGGQHPDLVGAAVGGELGERAREQQVAGGGRHRAAGDGDDGRAAAAQVRAVEDVVVDERGRVDELDGDRGAQQAGPTPSAGGPAATNTSSGRRRLPPAEIVAPGVLAEHRPVRGGDLGQARLEPLEHPGDVRAPGLDDGGDRLGGGHQRDTVPECSAMIPPAVRIQRTSVRPGPRQRARRAARGRGSASPTSAGTCRPRGLRRSVRASARRDQTKSRRTWTAAAASAS